MRLLLTLGTLALALACYGLMLRGWRRRQRRQADLPAPPVPTPGAALLGEPVPGLFVGTTGAEHWLDRVAVHGLSDRLPGSLVLAEDGVRVGREGRPDLLLPWGDLRSAEVETALGGRVVSTGMLLLTWQLGPRVVRSGFRADDPAHHDVLRTAITDRLATEALQ